MFNLINALWWADKDFKYIKYYYIFQYNNRRQTYSNFNDVWLMQREIELNKPEPPIVGDPEYFEYDHAKKMLGQLEPTDPGYFMYRGEVVKYKDQDLCNPNYRTLPRGKIFIKEPNYFSIVADDWLTDKSQPVVRLLVNLFKIPDDDRLRIIRVAMN